MESYKDLSKPLPKEGIEKTTGKETRKNYPTTNWIYQFYVNRFNEVLGEKWGYDWNIIKELEGKYRSGQPYFETIVSVSIWVNNKENERTHVGNHTSSNFGDSLKGAISSGFKKTAAFWGVGNQAYCGLIDDDTYLPDADKNKSYGEDEIKIKGDFDKALEAIKNIAEKKDAVKIQKLIEERKWEGSEKTDLLKLLKAQMEIL